MLRLFLAAIPIQLVFLAGHFGILHFAPKNFFLREALPLLYLAFTYIQWLGFAFFISLKTGKRVPILLHLPHLLSFLPLLRHIMLSAARTPSDVQSLSYAWLHTVSTHIFSLIAAWLWQTKENKWDLSRIELARTIFYGAAALTTVFIYAGLDFAFAESMNPVATGALQLALALAVTGFLLFRSPSVWAIVAAIFFSLGNAVLLFDNARADIGVEVTLAATSLTQYFSLYVFESNRQRVL